MLCLERELIEACQKVSDHRDPDLGEHSVGSRAEEPFYLEILLDALEEQFDLPAGLIDVGDSARCEFEVIGQERMRLAGFGIDITDASELSGILLFGIEPGKFDLVIGGHTGGLANPSPLYDTILRVGLELGHKVYLS